MAEGMLLLQPFDLPNRRAYKGMPAPVRTALVALLFAAVSVGGLLCTRYLYFTSSLVARNSFLGSNSNQAAQTHFPLNCPTGRNLSGTCPANYYPSGHQLANQDQSPPSCPDYFRWIHEDLRPWKKTGITRETVMSARAEANFRLVVLKGKVYLETYKKAFQSRDTFTVWRFLQLLRRYPGKVPDLDLMFHCDDLPVIMKGNFEGNEVPPPPLFRYCGDNNSFSIVFPDWSFWGWPEINIKPWKALLEDLQEGNRRTEWIDRAPQAYWKGNPEVSQARLDLLQCNESNGQDWNVRVYKQDWVKEEEVGYKNSDLADQCIHRYKIYVEGRTWSVSAKYILACDSVTLVVRNYFYDFFTRSLEPLKHYWPVNDDDMCKSIKYAVDWGNSHKQQAEAIGEAGSRFVLEEVKMEYVYDYMFHVLNEYAKLLKYKPTVPENAIEVCSELMGCSTVQGLTEKFMTDSLVDGPDASPPCAMAPPLDLASLQSVVRRNSVGREQVEGWESEYWQMRRSGM